MNTDTATELVTCLSEVEAVLDRAGVSISAFDPEGLCSTLATVRRLQRRLDATVACIAQRASELEAAGDGPGVDQTLLGTGEVSAKRARTEVARPATADLFPLLGDAWRRGAAGTEHLDAVARAADRLTDEERTALVAVDAKLADWATSLPPETFHRRLWDRINRDIRNDGGKAELEQQRADSRVTWWTERATGMGRISAALDPLRWEAVINTLNAEMRSQANERDGDTALDAHLAADAFTNLLTADPSTRRARRAGTQLTVVVDAKTLLEGFHPGSVHETSAGTPLSRDTIDRLACDAIIRRVTLDGRRVPISVGRTHRTATSAQWAALQALYRTCAWWRCDRPIGWCEAHHIIEWNDDGLTDLDNLIPLCSKHHHQVHEGGWRLRLEPDRTLQIQQPDGRHWRTTRPDRGDPRSDPPRRPKQSDPAGDPPTHTDLGGPADDPPTRPEQGDPGDDTPVQPERGPRTPPAGEGVHSTRAATRFTRSRRRSTPGQPRTRLDRESSQATSNEPEPALEAVSA